MQKVVIAAADDDNNKEYRKERDHCHFTGKYRGAVHSICNVIYKDPKNIPLNFHNGSNHEYHFIIRELAKEFEEKLKCLVGSTEKYIPFSVPIKKEDDNSKKIAYK